MFRESDVPVLGGVENMGPLTCPRCQGDVDILPGARESRAIWSTGVSKLAELPFDPALSHIAEENKPFLVADPQSLHAKRLRHLAETVAAAVNSD